MDSQRRLKGIITKASVPQYHASGSCFDEARNICLIPGISPNMYDYLILRHYKSMAIIPVCDHKEQIRSTVNGVKPEDMKLNEFTSYMNRSTKRSGTKACPPCSASVSQGRRLGFPSASPLSTIESENRKREIVKEWGNMIHF